MNNQEKSIPKKRGRKPGQKDESPRKLKSSNLTRSRVRSSPSLPTNPVIVDQESVKVPPEQTKLLSETTGAALHLVNQESVKVPPEQTKLLSESTGAALQAGDLSVSTRKRGRPKGSKNKKKV